MTIEHFHFRPTVNEDYGWCSTSIKYAELLSLSLDLFKLYRKLTFKKTSFAFDLVLTNKAIRDVK